MKDSITKFDLEKAFKALDEMSYPEVSGFCSTRPNIKESFGCGKSMTEALVEDYYNIEDDNELQDAAKEREAEIAKAKLARIEKIVDLDAKSEDDLLASYEGKVIIQCPQCLTLFYKNEEDIEADETNPEVVNINEACQHCGNTSGYALIGKVAPINDTEKEQFENVEEHKEEDVELENEEENLEEEPVEEEKVETKPENSKKVKEETEDEDIDLSLDLEEEPAEEEEEEKKREESLNLSKEAKLENESENKAAKAVLLNENIESEIDNIINSWYNESLNEDAEISDADIEKLLRSEEFQTPISETEVENILDEEPLKECDIVDAFEDLDDIDEELLEGCISDSLEQVYDNVDDFKVENCEVVKDKFIVEGKINFKSGKSKKTSYIFTEAKQNKKNIILTGINETLSNNGTFELAAKVKNKSLISESLKYSYSIDKTLVEGLGKNR
jgi:hypothetical protein